jgi:predicted transcriptional regulator
MSRRPSSFLTDGELRIMRVLWSLERATVAEIVERMKAADANVPAYNSVLTVLRILERKGYVTHRKGSRAFTFEPVVGHSVARKSALTQLLTRFFEGSPAMLVLDLFGHDAMDADELTRLRALIDGTAPPAKNSKAKTTRGRRP